MSERVNDVQVQRIIDKRVNARKIEWPTMTVNLAYDLRDARDRIKELERKLELNNLASR